MFVNNTDSHRTGQSWLTTWTPDLVAAAPDPVNAFALYAQQVLGIPWATVKDMVVLRQRIADIFEHCPQANYYTLCRVIRFCKTKGIRKSRVWALIDEPFRQAWAAKALPELDEPVHDEGIEQRIADALDVETDPSWRRRLIGCIGTSSRSRVLNDWMQARSNGLA